MEVLVNSARGSEFEFSESHHYHLVDDEFTDLDRRDSFGLLGDLG